MRVFFLKEKYEDAIRDSSKALEYNPDYMKALLRRAELYERVEKLDEALEDYKKAFDRDPSLHQARAACMVYELNYTYNLSIIYLF